MSNQTKTVNKQKSALREYPKIAKTEEGSIDVQMSSEMSMNELMGMKTYDAAQGVFRSAIGALGNSLDIYGNMVAAMNAELEPRDAIEAMLIVQMSVTHIAMTTLIERMSYQNNSDVRESLERSVTRLSRTYLAQMDAFKKYRAKAQQTVRVERVTVNEGGQAIVGDVTRQGEG
jgi:hypothetical protein